MPRRANPSSPPSREPTASRGTRAALTAAFVLSGAAGLVYESIWSRYLGLFVGHGAYAQTIVLVIFMGGMAAGALAVGRRSERWKDPLLIYVAIELAIAALGLAFHPAFVAITDLAYQAWFPRLGESAALPILKWGLAGAMILPQSVLLGATFPLMSAGLLRRMPQAPGRVVAGLYFANSLGGAAGVLASGFWLVKVVGLPGTLTAAALLNLAAAAFATFAGRRRAVAGGQGLVPAPEVWRPKGAAPAGPSWIPRLLIAVSCGTAVASFVYEIAWVRMLSLVLGSATHSFELMLSAFILGLALGAWWVHGRADRFAHPLRALAITQWVMGALALATLPIYGASFDWMAGLVTALQATPRGYETFSLARYAICLAVMLPATFCAGITLPLITRILMARGGEPAIGAVYGANTLGSIVGAALAGLVLLPWLGLERLLAAGAAIDLALGVALLASEGRQAWRRAVPVAAAAGLAVVAGTMAFARLDRLRLVSGVYRTGALLDPGTTQLVYYHDGRTATVSVRRNADGSQTLSTNGKPDASVSLPWLSPDPIRPRLPMTDDESTQILLSVIALAYAPAARDAAVVGIGSGMTSHVLLGQPGLRRVLTVEIEPDMIEAARLFRPANRRVFEDPRSTLVVDDARSYFAASGDRFDLIISEPSNPWVSGVSGLFTDEFYRRVGGSLTERGVFGQWLHIYSLDDDLVLGVLAGIARHFRDFEIHLVSSTDMLIVATNRPGGLEPDWSVAGLPGIAEDLRWTLPFTPEVFSATRVAGRQALAPLLDATPPNSDFFPTLDLRAERARFDKQLAVGMMLLHYNRFGIASATAATVGPPREANLPLPFVLRVRSLMWVARLREALAGRAPGANQPQDLRDRLSASLERLARVGAPGETARAPDDWRVWLGDAITAEDDLHKGTTGYADEAFFAALRRSVTAARAPAPVAHAVEWMHALARREMVRASALTDTLIAASLAGGPWIPADLLLDGGTTAKLALGDLQGARRVYRAVAPSQARPASDLRSRVLAAMVADR